MDQKLRKAQSTNTVISIKEETPSTISFEKFDPVVVIRCLLEVDDFGNLIHQKELLLEISRCILTGDLKLAQFYASASASISHFSEKHILLVQQIMNTFPWTIKHESVVRAFSEWICNLVSTQNGFVEYVCRFLAAALRPNPLQNKAIQGPLRLELTTREPEEIVTRERVLDIIKKVLILSPRSTTLLEVSLERAFPHVARFSTYQLRIYLKNIIILSKNHLELREQILAFCIRKMVDMDVLISLEEIPEEEDLLFSVEIDDSTKQMLDVAEKLDHCMDAFLQELDAIFQSGDHSIFQVLIRAFDSSLLSVVKSKYTQFVLFYFCRLKVEFADEFLMYLLMRLFDSNLSVLTRRTCAAYVGSFLSRASYVPHDLVKKGLNQLFIWMHQYIDRQGDRVLPDPDVHALFYSVVQSTCYIVCFYQSSIFDGLSGREYFDSLNFERIAACRLNPLKFCVDAILNEFVNITRRLNIISISEVSKKNEKIILSNAYRNLEPYFPFDPYLLRVSSKLINPIYRQWSSNNGGNADEDELSEQGDSHSQKSASHSSTPQTGSLDIKNMSFTPTISHLEYHFRNSLEV